MPLNGSSNTLTITEDEDGLISLDIQNGLQLVTDWDDSTPDTYFDFDKNILQYKSSEDVGSGDLTFGAPDGELTIISGEGITIQPGNDLLNINGEVETDNDMTVGGELNCDDLHAQEIDAAGSVNTGDAYKIGGATVLDAQMEFISGPSGGATVDAESRVAIFAIIDSLRDVKLMANS